MNSKVKSVTQDQKIYEHIFDAILEQRLAPGIKLTEEGLGEVFGVSRTIIRRALVRLTHEGVIELIPNRGAYVAKPNVEEARQVLDARRLIELALVERVVARGAQLEREIKTLRSLIKEEHASAARADTGTAIRLSGEFHLELAQLANNEPMANFLRALVSQTSLIIAMYESSQGSNCAIDEHSRLLDAIEQGDKKTALSLMAEHLDHIEARLELVQGEQEVDLAKVFAHLRVRA
ncbi:MAG TPA: GntR family transcriptional regulator [Marinobacterium sp.]|nr:GntR family transcriptional regulator [Marinobacterium sp.]